MINIYVNPPANREPEQSWRKLRWKEMVVIAPEGCERNTSNLGHTHPREGSNFRLLTTFVYIYIIHVTFNRRNMRRKKGNIRITWQQNHSQTTKSDQKNNYWTIYRGMLNKLDKLKHGYRLICSGWAVELNGVLYSTPGNCRSEKWSFCLKVIYINVLSSGRIVCRSVSAQ